MKEKVNKKIIIIASSIFILLCIYFGLSIYFMSHFYFGTTINNVNVSGKTAKEVEEEISSNVNLYKLELEERGGEKEYIDSKSIELEYSSGDQIESIKNNQNPFKWILILFSKENHKVSGIITYDEELLKKNFDNLSCLDLANVVEPENPIFKYSDGKYEIASEIYGNRINKEILYDNIVESITSLKPKLDLELINCYELPKYSSSSKEVIDAKNLLNKYLSAKINYSFGDKIEVLDSDKINEFLEVDENFNVTINEDKVKKYVSSLSNIYDTYAKTREFKTSLGTMAKVSGGNYGWLINSSKEVENIVNNIKDGQVVDREPIYKKTAINRGVNDIGSTYVEINLSKQCLWFYKDGKVIVQGNVVTGNVSLGHSTPVGVYELNYKQKDAILQGEDYSSPVRFWMPFNGGIGIHDASWRTDFGGSIYKSSGSHGCVNSPYYLAKTIFDNIEPGTPIICYVE